MGIDQSFLAFPLSRRSLFFLIHPRFPPCLTHLVPVFPLQAEWKEIRPGKRGRYFFLFVTTVFLLPVPSPVMVYARPPGPEGRLRDPLAIVSA